MTQAPLHSRYSRWSIGLHWLMAALLIATAATMELKGIYPKGSAGRELMKSVHFSLGLSVLALVWLRLLARVLGTTPAITPRPPAWQLLIGRMVHWGLYALMIGLPLLGWLTLSAKGAPVSLPGGILLPLLPVEQSKEWAGWFKEWHETGATVGYVLVGLHVAAALGHHYVQRDNTLRRMLPGGQRSE